MQRKAPQGRRPATRARRWRRGLLRGIVGVVMAGALLFGLLQTPWAKRGIARGITRLASGVLGQRVELSGLQGFLPVNMTVQRIRVADAQGEWLAIDQAHLAWRPRALLRREVALDVLSAASIRWSRRPTLLRSEGGAEPSAPGRPALPGIRCDDLHVDHLEIGEAVAGQRVVLSCGAALALLTEGDGVAAQLTTAGDLESRLVVEARWLAGGELQGIEVSAEALATNLYGHAVMVRGSISEGRVSPAGLAARVEGEIALDRDRMELRSNVAYTPGGVGLSNLWSRAHGVVLTGDLHIVPGPLGATGALRAGIDDLATVGARLGVVLGGRLEGALVLRAGARGQEADVALRLADVSTPWGSAAALEGAAQTLLVDGRPEGTWRCSASDYCFGDLTVSTARLSWVGGVLTNEISLAAEGDAGLPIAIAGHGRLEVGDGRVSLGAEGASARVGPVALATEHPFSVRYGEGLAQIHDLRARLFGGEITLDARYGGGGVTGRLEAAEIRVAEIPGLPFAGMEGRLGGRVSLAGDLANPEISVAATLVDLAGTNALLRGLSHMDLDAAWHVAAGRATGHLQAHDRTGSVVRVAGDVPLEFGLQPWRLALTPGADAGLSMTSRLDLATLNAWEAGTGLQWQGALAADARAERLAGVRTLRGDVTVTEGAVWQSTGGLSVTGITARLTCAPTNGVSFGERAQMVPSAHLPEPTAFALDASAFWQTNLSVSVAGWGAWSSNVWGVAVDRLQGNVGVFELAADSATRLVADATGWHLSPCVLNLGTGRVMVAADVQEASVDASMTVTNVALAELPLAALQSWRGCVSGALSVVGRPEAPRIQGGLRVDGIVSTRDQLDDLPAMDVAATVMTTNGMLVVLGRAGPDQSEQITIDARLPVTPSLSPFALNFREEDAMRVGIRTDLDLSILGLLNIFSEARIAGRLRSDVLYTVEHGRRAFQGDCVLAGGIFEVYPSGTFVERIDLRLRADGDRLVLEHAEATDGSDGRLALDGELRVVAGTGVVYRASAEAKSMRFVNHPAVTATASGKVTLEGVGGGMEVAGQITLDEAIVQLNRLRRRPPATLVDDRALAAPKPAKRRKAPRAGRQRIKVDLALEAPGTIFVRSTDLESVWRARMRLLNEAAGWRLKGEVNPIRGTVVLLSRSFRLVDGEIMLDGLLPIDPALRLVAEYTRPELTAQVHLRGNLSNLRLQLESMPPMPQDEIIAQVLFGRNLDSISTLQMLQVARAAAGLSQGRGVDVVDRMRTRLGVDQLGLRESSTGAANETEVAAGKYLSERAFVEVSQALSTGGAKIRAEYQITPHFAVETDAGTGMRPGFGITWRRDY